jgi:hypothetical protein
MKNGRYSYTLGIKKRRGVNPSFKGINIGSGRILYLLLAVNLLLLSLL